MKKLLTVLGLVVALAMTGLSCMANPEPKKSGKDKNTLRLLYWNIQNGMWAGQPDNYDKFVEFVKAQDPDVCVWCEAETIYEDGTSVKRDKSQRYLPDHWGELAARYGHRYWYKSGHRDSYPQVITSRYPITNIAQIIGQQPDSVVTHGAGWAQIEKNGNLINIVSLHTWPQRYRFPNPPTADERKLSADNNEGDRYRRMEIEYVCRHTIGQVPEADSQLWMMMGDFNSRSSVDNHFYKMNPDTTAFLVHDYIRQNTPYIDVIAEKYPGEFKSSVFGKQRIDYVYCTKPLYDRIKFADIIRDNYTEPIRDPQKKTGYCIPSDHCPILVDFDMSKTGKKKK